MSLADFIAMRVGKLNIDWDVIDPSRKPKEYMAAHLYQMAKIAKAYHKKNERRVAIDRFLVTYMQVTGEVSKAVAEQYRSAFLEKVDFFDEQTLRIKLSYYLRDFPSRTAAPDITVERLLAFMIKNKITNNKDLLAHYNKFESFSRDNEHRLREVAEALIFNRPLPARESKSPKRNGRMSRKELVAALDACLNK